MKINSNKEAMLSPLSSLLAIMAGLLFGLIILYLTNPKYALEGFLMILKGGFESGAYGIGQTISIATPIIFTGLSVAFAFNTGLFNIGASGQFSMGAFVAITLGIRVSTLPFPIHWLLCIILAMVAGGLWGFVPGILKAKFNVNEVISSIMLNYIGIYFINMMIPRIGIYDQLKNQTMPVKPSAMNPRLGLDRIFEHTNLDIGILLAILSAVVIYILMKKTTLGYELKACGLNKHAGKYAGINKDRSIILSMTIAGVLSGLGGALLYLGHTGKYMIVLDIIALEGFNGISVALLAASHPISVIFTGLFIAHIIIGGSNLQLYNFVPEVIDMIVAVIIYFGAFSLLFKNIVNRTLSSKKPKTIEKEV